MLNKEIIEVLKKGIKTELDSITVYSNASEISQGDVKVFFLERAGEEKQHYNWLLNYFQSLSGGLVPSENLIISINKRKISHEIITDDFLKRIGFNQHLTTAIATALLLEISSIRFYQEAASKTSNTALIDLFSALAEWEDRHYHELLQIQEESENYWFEKHQFKPF